VVSGRRSPHGISEINAISPTLTEHLLASAELLERHFGDMQEVEFTIQSGQLWLLQSRPGARSRVAAIKIAHDLFREGTLDAAGAQRLTAGMCASDVTQTYIRTLQRPFVSGTGASSGAAVGRVQASERLVPAREGTILVIDHFDQGDDLSEVNGTNGIVALRGGVTSHAVVLARSLGIPVVVGVPNSAIREEGAVLGGIHLHNGSWLSIDGSSGAIFRGRLEISSKPAPGLTPDVVEWFRTHSLGMSRADRRGSE